MIPVILLRWESRLGVGAWSLGLQGSKDPNIRVLGPKYYNMNGIWALKPHYLGPWTRKGGGV